MSCFNPRTRVGCDGIRIVMTNTGGMFQSTHPRGVRRNNGVQHRPVHRVSIHAPAWGATSLRGEGVDMEFVSIHAPAWGATPHNTSSLLIFWSFNPRTRVGCDAPDPLPVCDGQAGFNPRTRVGCDENPCAGSRAQKVSIHAPAWGATRRGLEVHCGFSGFNPRTRVGCDRWRTLPANWSCTGFNPRTRVGCDELLFGHVLDGLEFQSTHPRGVRHTRIATMNTGGMFQSTHPRGVRLHSDPSPLGQMGFNPRTRVGCDKRLLVHQAQREDVSIHAPAWGATCLRPARPSGTFRFNPRTRVGCDLHICNSETYPNRFQSTHPRGVRRLPCCCPGQGHPGFNPRTRVGCDVADAPSARTSVSVSIHAPAWGATEFWWRILYP